LGKNKNILFIFIFYSFIFSEVTIKYKENICFNGTNASALFLNEDKIFLELSCEPKSLYPCRIFTVNSYNVQYSGYDGMIAENKSLTEINITNIDTLDLQNIRLPNYTQYNIVGFVLATAGATGHGTQNFYLINLDTAQWTVISNYDMIAPQWFYNKEIFGYIEQKEIYIGSPNFPVGCRYITVIDAFKIFDYHNFSFYEDKEVNDVVYNNELAALEFNDSILELFTNRNFSEINDYFDCNYEQSSFEIFMKYIYYSKKLKHNQKLKQEIYPLLDPTLLKYF